VILSNVPKLRFGEFEGEWEKSTLKQLLNKLIDCEHKTAPYIESSKYYVIRTNNVKDGRLHYGDMKYTTEAGFNEWTKRDVPSIGDILFTREAPAGESCLVPKNKMICLGQRMVSLKPNLKKVKSSFLLWYLQSNIGRKKIQNFIIGTTVTRINIKDIYRVNISFSTLTEQEKIATFLTSIDKKTEQLTQKKTLLESYKKGVMQKIFSQELRFKRDDGGVFEDWEEKKLGDIAIFSKGKGISKSDIIENGKIECIRYGELYTHYNETISDIKSSTNLDIENLILSQYNDVIIPASGETQIDIATASCVLKDNIALSGDLNIIRTNENGVFLSYYLNSFKRFDIARLAQGVSVVHLYTSQLKQLKLNLPQMEEQQKISNFLTSIDQKITQTTQQIEAMKSFKKGLLQQMFV